MTLSEYFPGHVSLRAVVQPRRNVLVIVGALGSCRHCHGDALNGGQVDPTALIGPNLTPAGRLGTWTQEEFINTIRTGLRPDGTSLDPFMPWPRYRDMTDEELKSLWAYLQSLEPLETAMQ